MSSKTIYQSPLCSCIICRETKSAKGIHSHYHAAHTAVGRTHVITASALGNASPLKYKKIKDFTDSKEREYFDNPKYCMTCSQLLPYNKRHNKFCDRSCSAINSNDGRGPRSDEVKSKIRNTLKNNPLLQPAERTKIAFKHCPICNTNFIWKQNISKSYIWCSDACAAKGRSENARNNPGLGTKRSKQEIELFELCNNYFTHVTHNEKLFNGWDADILIYDIKTAIMWNGPWHYMQMNFSNHSLAQVQNRDKIKQKEIVDAGWSFLVFEDRYYSPKTAFDQIIGESTGDRTQTGPC